MYVCVVCQQKRSLEKVRVEFNEIEMALKSRMGEIMEKIEEEVMHDNWS